MHPRRHAGLPPVSASVPGAAVLVLQEHLRAHEARSQTHAGCSAGMQAGCVPLVPRASLRLNEVCGAAGWQLAVPAVPRCVQLWSAPRQHRVTCATAQLLPHRHSDCCTVTLDECTERARLHSGIAAQLSSPCPYLTRWPASAEHAEQAPTLPDAQEVECTMAALHLIFPSVQQCIAEWRKHAGITDLNKVCTLPR